MVWYLMISYDSIAWYCMLLRCWLRRAGYVSQDAYILHNIIITKYKMKIVSFLLLIAWCWCLWLFLYLQTSRTTTPAADASGYLKRFAILRNLVRLQKPEVKAPQSKVVSYGTSFFLVAEGSSVVSTSSENQKLLQLSDLRKRETGGSAWRKMGGLLGK